MAQLVKLKSQRQKKMALNKSEVKHCQKLVKKCGGCVFMENGGGESCQIRLEMMNAESGVPSIVKIMLRKSGIGPQPFVKRCGWKQETFPTIRKDRQFTGWFLTNILQDFPDWPLGADDWYTLRTLRIKPGGRTVLHTTYSGWVNQLAKVLVLPCDDYDLVWDWVLEHCKDSKSPHWLELVMTATEKIRRVVHSHASEIPPERLSHLL